MQLGSCSWKSLSVAKKVVLSSDLSASGEVVLGSHLSISKKVVLASTLSVGGHANLTTELYVGGNITVGGSYIIPSTIGSAGYALKVPSSGNILEWGEVQSTSGSSLALTNTLSIANKSVLSSDLSAAGEVVFASHLSVAKKSNII